MKRLGVAAITIAVAGLVWFGAPADGSTTFAGLMVSGGPGGFKYAKGTCPLGDGPDGNFSIVVGDAIRWENCTNTDHTVTGDNGTFGSTEPVAPNSSVTITFNSPGTFPYHCNFHPAMTGTVTVTGEPTTTTATAPPTTPTTAKPTTTTTAAPTTTTDNIEGVFGTEATSSTTSTTGDPTVTTRALGAGGSNGGTSAGLVALLILGLGGVGTAGALLLRRLRAPAVPPTD